MVPVQSTLLSSLFASFNSFKLLENIVSLAVKHLGIKGVTPSFHMELDPELKLMDVRKKYENLAQVLHIGILMVLTCFIPVFNMLAKDNVFTSLTSDINDGIKSLTSAASFALSNHYDWKGDHRIKEDLGLKRKRIHCVCHSGAPERQSLGPELPVRRTIG
jgi:hypothetical protein